MPIKDRRTKILMMLLLLSEAPSIQTGVDFSPVEITPVLQTVFDIMMNQKTKGTLTSLVKEELIQHVTSENSEKSVYALTLKGYQFLCLQFPFFRFLKEEWDGRWRIISYEIPESKREIRDRLRREMKGWGLGPWHRSFWMTPHPIVSNLRDLVFGREEEKYVQAFESTHVFGDMNLLVEKVWEKTELDKKYRALFRLWHETLSTEKEKQEKFATIAYSYINLLRDDPGLPMSLVGKKWIGFEAFSIFGEIKNILLKS
jgi:phenylacetic acid degradation operon negative regulatory protein